METQNCMQNTAHGLIRNRLRKWCDQRNVPRDWLDQKKNSRSGQIISHRMVEKIVAAVKT